MKTRLLDVHLGPCWDFCSPSWSYLQVDAWESIAKANLNLGSCEEWWGTWSAGVWDWISTGSTTEGKQDDYIHIYMCVCMSYVFIIYIHTCLVFFGGCPVAPSKFLFNAFPSLARALGARFFRSTRSLSFRIPTGNPFPLLFEPCDRSKEETGKTPCSSTKRP